MSLEAAEGEIRGRFAEASLVISHLRTIAPEGMQPVDDLQKALRGLCLITIYAAVERSANSIVESALSEMTSHATPSTHYIPSLHSVLHYKKVQSVRDCGFGNILEKSKDLFDAAFESSAAAFVENPLAERMQNVDGSTLEWIALVFGMSNYACDRANKGRLGNLRERRNAVAHGRETASSVGERFNLTEISNLYNAADAEITRLLIGMKKQCDERLYVRAAA